MKLVGLNMNLAPVVDVKSDETDRHLEGRTFGSDGETVARLGMAVVRAIQANGVMAVAKHFPGLGRAEMDPHHDILRIDADIQEMDRVHLSPFRAVMEEGVSAMMTSHAIYTSIDSERPATLSPVILNQLLREKMGYRGLVITDDLEMGAVAKKWGVVEGAAIAFAAGADILLICENQDKVMESYHIIRSGLLRGEIPFQRLHESYDRIMQLRSAYLKSPVTISLKKVEDYFRIEN